MAGTFISELFASLDGRWNEVNVLLELANAEEEKSSDLYHAVCRSTSLLLVSHFEGIIKETAKAIVQDLNKFSKFSDAPLQVRRTFCRPFVAQKEDDPKDIEQRTKKLIAVFDALDTKFEVEAFLSQNQFGNNNKNPSPNVIEKICENFGVRGFFKKIQHSSIEIVFSDTPTDLNNLHDELRTEIITNTKTFPYTINLAKFNIGPNPEEPDKKSLYEDFLDNLLKKRHGIAHGSDTENSSSVGDLQKDLVKVQFLVFAFFMVICDRISQPN
ncbi:MAG TPA: MAE_28990/MAE_18760 family HEPN-like nuclease [Stenomitos sp.]